MFFKRRRKANNWLEATRHILFVIRAKNRFWVDSSPVYSTFLVINLYLRLWSSSDSLHLLYFAAYALFTVNSEDMFTTAHGKILLFLVRFTLPARRNALPHLHNLLYARRLLRRELSYCRLTVLLWNTNLLISMSLTYYWYQWKQLTSI